jgi:hypothetical protein
LILKVGFLVAVLVRASVYLTRIARPGGERKTPIALLPLPFIAVMLLAAVSLTFAPRSHWHGLIVGDQWLECLISIPVIAVVPFAILIWAMRRAAPTELAGAGALVGLLAGCLSASGYALHCADGLLPFAAIWYGGTIALCTGAGWKLGPQLCSNPVWSSTDFFLHDRVAQWVSADFLHRRMGLLGMSSERRRHFSTC